MSAARAQPRPSSRSRRSSGTDSTSVLWSSRAFVLVLVIGCGAGFVPLVEGLGWLARPITLEIVAAIAMALTAMLARGRGWPLLVGTIVHLCGGTLAFAAGTGILGLVPTPQTLERFAQLVRVGSASVVEQSIPATPDEGLAFLLALGLVGLATALELLVFVVRAPALAALPVVVVSAVPNLIDPTQVQVPLFVVLAAAYVALLLVRRPRSSPGTQLGALGAGAAVIAGSLIVSALLPPVDTPDTAPALGNGYAIGVNPFADLGSDLRRPDPITAFTYTTDDTITPYFTLTVLDRLEGFRWANDVGGTASNDLAAIGPDPARADDARVSDTTSDVTVGDISGRLLPAPYAASSVDGLDGTWSWNSQTLAIESAEGTSLRGQSYEVQSQVAAPTLQQLRAAGTTVDPGMDRFLDVPADAPAIIRQTAERVASDADATSFYDIAEALQSYFQGPDFVYSTEAPVAQGYDGSGVDVIARFLQVKAGYCVHFSSAMALMARSLGIPARIGVGFTAGERIGTVGGVPQYQVTTDDLHAWPELYFHGVGWVRFEPTPGIGSVPSFPSQSTSTSTATSSAGPSSTATSTSTAPSGGSLAPEDEPTNGSSPGATGGITLPRGLVEGVLIGLVIVLVVIAPASVRGIRRRMRVARARDGDALAAWREVSDTAIDLGIPVLRTQSARALAAALAERAGPAADDPIGRLLAAVESRAYGPARSTAPGASPRTGTSSSPDVADVAATRRALARGSRPTDRLRAIVLPRSLLEPFRVDVDSRDPGAREADPRDS